MIDIILYPSDIAVNKTDENSAAVEFADSKHVNQSANMRIIAL